MDPLDRPLSASDVRRGHTVMLVKGRQRLAAFSLAIVVTAGAALLRALLSKWLAFELPYITFFAAVMIAAWYGGLWPGLFATALSAAAASYWFVDLIGPASGIGMFVFILTAGLMSVAAERLRSTREALARHHAVERQERQAADRAQALLAAVVESSEDAIFTKSLDGQILTWNAGAEHMFGYRAAEAIGGPVARIVPEQRRDEEDDILRRVSRGERVVPFETQRLTQDGTILDVSVTLSPIRDASGTIIGASSIARDISTRKKLDAAQREADRRKDDLLAVLAHELRNPLAPIRTSVALLQQSGAPNGAVARAAEVIDRQSRHMARLLDDLLDSSRITRDKFELRREALVLQDVLDAAIETTRQLFESQRQVLVLSLPDRPVALDGDPVRLAQVFGNLLSNASKYSHPGGRIEVSARSADGEVRVSVRDDGIGIEPAMLPRVFEMFSQASQALGRAQGGLGIGLALVKGIVELHGGRVSAHSDGIDRGSCFEVVLPIEPMTSQTAADRVAPDARPGATRILVVDDNHDGADSLALLLAAQGHVVSTQYDGESALAEADRFQPRVVLLDLGMPGLDGFATARRLRAAHPSVYLVAMTGWGQERYGRQTAEAGFDAHLVKPLDPEALGALLRTAIG